MSKGAKRLTVLTVSVAIMFAVISFQMSSPRNAVFWISSGFMVLAVLMMVYVIKTAFKDGSDVRSRFYGFPIVRVGAVYLVLQFLVSLFFMLGSKYFPVWPVLVSSLLCFLIAGAGLVTAEE